MRIRVYDCREQLELPRPIGSIRPKIQRGSGGFFAVQDEPARKTTPGSEGGATAPAAQGGTAAPQAQGAAGAPAAPPAGAGGIGGSGGGFGGGFAGGQEGAIEEISDSENLMNMITTIIDPEIWNAVGGPSSIAEYKGLISIAATQETHEKVERLLNMLHQAANLKELKVTVVE